MKQLIRLKVLLLSLVVALAAFSLAPLAPESVALAQEMPNHESEGGSQQFRLFHDVLHPLMHEALPHKDFKTMRARAGELVKRGRVIVKAGVPERVKDQEGFHLSLKDFDEELSAFRKAARGRDDKQLEKTFNALHDTFERLADMLPKQGSI